MRTKRQGDRVTQSEEDKRDSEKRGRGGGGGLERQKGGVTLK